ncbi:MAG: SDR family oxidoreductase [Pseudomonadales bacterium]|jgi:NAD(P)-dependent dehydrogenase (short-subunit alcohol dehydrogenase family)|nr:SDR family oxidoreductase [Pseudomonadales bacterium]
MSYFVTGATGFIGTHLVDRLLARRGTVYVLVRPGSRARFRALRERWGERAERVVPISGDLTRPHLGVSKKDLETLTGKITHLFHCGAIYDIDNSDAEAQHRANVDGTRHAVAFAEAVRAGTFHHVSSIAAAGMYRGHFREDMFDEWAPTEDPYFRTKHESEGVVRFECRIPFRIYRPGIVVGDSRTGEMGKIDGPYYLFKLIQKLRNALPRWMPLIGVEGGKLNIVPVDFVTAAMDQIAHQRKVHGDTFHLVAHEPIGVGEAMNLFAEAAHAPRFSLRIDHRLLAFLPRGIVDFIGALPPVKRIVDTLLADLGIPRALFSYMDFATLYDDRETRRALKGSGIECPKLADYAPVLWDYWERKLDPDLFRDHSLAGRVRDRVILITGASSGIGKAAALHLATAGARVLLVARKLEKLEETRREIEARGGRAWIYSADVSSLDGCDKLVADVLAEHGHVDVLVNNAGRSIRRSLALSYDRFHDFERTMQLNYFGSVRLIMNLLPSMTERRDGQIVNVSSIGVQANMARFSAYVASKAALDAFSRCAQTEFLDRNLTFTNVYMPLVRTPMIAPTSHYKYVPTLSPEEAAEMVARAIIDRPKQVSTRLGTAASVAWALWPKAMDVILNTGYQLFPDSAAAKGDRDGLRAADTEMAPEAAAFAALTRGIHW